MHFFITGHTGFKGSWLVRFLQKLGHEVSGYSLDIRRGGLFESARLEGELLQHTIGDIRDSAKLEKVLKKARPDVVIHMAAQPLVLESYAKPAETFSTNVTGTLNLLQAVSNSGNCPITLIVTTDKVYRVSENKQPHREGDPLGGLDPYAASKAMADLLAQSWAYSQDPGKILIARAGNVIGAHDVSPNRLIPDAIRAIRSGGTLRLRYPEAVRPWQHVLDCLAGYLSYVGVAASEKSLPEALNFGPDAKDFFSVREVVTLISELDGRLKFSESPDTRMQQETLHLRLDSSNAQEILGWRNSYDLKHSVSMSLGELQDQEPRTLVDSQIDSYLDGEQGKALSELLQ